MFNLFWYAVFRPCPVAVFVVQNSFVIMTDFSRQDLVEMLNKNGISPAATNFRERVEKYILIHFDLLKEELVDPKKYKNLDFSISSPEKNPHQNDFLVSVNCKEKCLRVCPEMTSSGGGWGSAKI